MHSKSWRALGVLVLLAVLGAALWWLQRAVPVPSLAPVAPLQFVGSAACAQCHATPTQDWSGSHHALAMQEATRAAVLAPFGGERFTHGGVTSTFSQRADKFYVRTDGHDGQLREFEVTHTLGVTPLQQYLIPVAKGGMQALGIAWDARPRAQGGQRWFQLQAGERVKAGDELHWTGRQQNFNFMCAECHVTQFKKNFNPQTRTFASTWSEMNVACEACHGPGSGHVAWAGSAKSPYSLFSRASDPSKGLALSLNERQGVSWTLHPQTGNATRHPPQAAPGSARLPGQEVEMCGRCHAHRSQFSDDYAHGKPLLDTHVPSLLAQGLYHSDGQMQAEVYNYASFLQSKMHQQGVSCSDCHNPHSLKLRAPGNATCFQCHASAQYEAPAHHHHATGSAGASCAACHMPTTTYMTVDPRHDHSIRVPRPDLSQRLGTPNACSQCHADQPVAWAAQWAGHWYPRLQERPTPLAEALHASEVGSVEAPQLLQGVVADPLQSGMARASALARLPAPRDRAEVERLGGWLSDADPLVRHTAVEALATTPLELRARLLLPLLADPVQAVRMAAARWLAGAPQGTWTVQQRADFERALGEYIAAQQFNADRPESYSNLGLMYADQGQWSQAEAALQTAIAMAPTLALPALNLADVYRAMGREDQAQALMRGVIRREPKNALAFYALGLSLYRQQRSAAAVQALHTAARLEPQNPRYAAVYAQAREAAARPHPPGAAKP